MNRLAVSVRLLYGLLLVAGIGGLWWQAPANTGMAPKIIMATVVYLPLLIMGLGVLLKDARLLTWLCFLLLFYFCGYVTQVMDPSLRWLALLRVLLVCLLFTASLFYIRSLNHTPKQQHIKETP